MPVLSKESRDIDATKECRFTLKCACYVIKTYIQMPHTDKYSHLNSIIWPVLLNDWVFVYELSRCRSIACHIKLFKGKIPKEGSACNIPVNT